MNINILRYSLFGIAGGQEVIVTFKLISILISTNQAWHQTIGIHSFFPRLTKRPPLVQLLTMVRIARTLCAAFSQVSHHVITGSGAMFSLRFGQVRNCPNRLNRFGLVRICPKELPKLAQICPNAGEVLLKVCISLFNCKIDPKTILLSPRLRMITKKRSALNYGFSFTAIFMVSKKKKKVFAE